MRNAKLLTLLTLLSVISISGCAGSPQVGKVVQAPEQPKPLMPAALREVPPEAETDYLKKLDGILSKLEKLLTV